MTFIGGSIGVFSLRT